MTKSHFTRACVIGWPIEHSRSPLIHDTWIKEHAINGRYEKEAVSPEDTPDFLRNLTKQGYVGCNVTVPLKEIAFETADWCDESAKAVNAANTVWVDRDKLCVMNTDTYGFMTHLSKSAPHWHNSDKPIVILGAGGAARAIIFGFLEEGRKQIRVFNRTKSKSQALVEHFGPNVIACDWNERLRAAQDCSVIVNTTTIGMNNNGNLDVDFSHADDHTIVCDIVYVPLRTQFLNAAASYNLVTVDGLGMLLHQAVPGFEKWFGVRPEVTKSLRSKVLLDIEKMSC